MPHWRRPSSSRHRLCSRCFELRKKTQRGAATLTARLVVPGLDLAALAPREHHVLGRIGHEVVDLVVPEPEHAEPPPAGAPRRHDVHARPALLRHAEGQPLVVLQQPLAQGSLDPEHAGRGHAHAHPPRHWLTAAMPQPSSCPSLAAAHLSACSSPLRSCALRSSADHVQTDIGGRAGGAPTTTEQAAARAALTAPNGAHSFREARIRRQGQG